MNPIFLVLALVTGVTIKYVTFDLPHQTRVQKLINLGFALGHRNERIPWAIALDCAARDPGLLALFIGVANWGVDWTGYPGRVPSDPMGIDWAGPGIGDGKHLLDHRWDTERDDAGEISRSGGLGIRHGKATLIDQTYQKFGRPKLPESVLGQESFVTYWADSDRAVWEAWARTLLHRHDFQRWFIEDYLNGEWADARRLYPRDASIAVLAARINNSSPAALRCFRREGLSTFDAIAAAYADGRAGCYEGRGWGQVNAVKRVRDLIRIAT